jgi:hypothetical protein
MYKSKATNFRSRHQNQKEITTMTKIIAEHPDLKEEEERKLQAFMHAVDAHLMYLSGTQDEVRDDIRSLQKWVQVAVHNGKTHTIGGYAYGRTTKNDHPFIILYPAAAGLQHKVCRVYTQDFSQLPEEINTLELPSEAQSGNPTKDEAQKKGLYFVCKPFIIATEDGDETQMGPEQRFLLVLDELPHQQRQTIAYTQPTTSKSAAIPFVAKTPEQPINAAAAAIQETAMKILDASDNPDERLEEINKELGLVKSTGSTDHIKNDPGFELQAPKVPYKYTNGDKVAEDNHNERVIFLAHHVKTHGVAENKNALIAWYLDHKDWLDKQYPELNTK